MFSLAILSAYISILALTLTSIVLYNYESKRLLAYGFILESVVILTALVGLHGLSIVHVLRIVSALIFILYAIRLKKKD